MSGRGCYVRAMVTFFLVLIALCLAAAAYTYFQVRNTDQRLKPDGAFADVDGIRLHYHFYEAQSEEPEAATLVFLHGASGNAYDMRLAFLEALRGRHRLLFVDRPGLGYSSGKAGIHDLPSGQAWAIDLLLEKLGIRNAIVVGHSLAGSVTAALGLSAPERVRGLAFLAPVSHPWPGGVNWYYNVASWPLIGPIFCWTLTLPVGKRLAPAAMTNVFLPDCPPENYGLEIRLPLLFRPASFRANARQVAHLKPVIAVQSKSYSRMSQPALVVTGTEDSVVWPSIHCEGLLQDLPHAQLLCLDKAGHMPHHTHTAMIVRGLEQLVRRVENGEQKLADDQRVLDPVDQN